MSRCGQRDGNGCGRELLWALDENGKVIPLEKDALPIYQLGEWDAASNRYAVTRATGVRVLHHAVCPKRDNFKKPKPQGT